MGPHCERGVREVTFLLLIHFLSPKRHPVSVSKMRPFHWQGHFLAQNLNRRRDRLKEKSVLKENKEKSCPVVEGSGLTRLSPKS